MTFRKYIYVMLLTTLLCWTAFVITLFNVDPTDTNFLGFFFFYISFFLALIGSNSLIGLFWRMNQNKEELPLFRLVTIAHRQSILVALLLTGCLFLQSRSLLSWWNALLFLITLTLFEFFVMSTNKQRKKYRS